MGCGPGGVVISWCVCAGVVEDVLLVPVNISYDRLLEKSFVKDELMVWQCVCVCVCVCCVCVCCVCVCVVSGRVCDGVCREERRDQRQ